MIMNASENNEEITMVAVPAIKGHMEKHFRPLLANVETATGLKLKFIEASSYDDAIDRLKDGQAQLGWLGQSAFIEASHDVSLEPLAVAFTADNSVSVYRSVFLVNTGSTYTEIADLKGHRLILTEHGSSSGDIMPRHTLAQFEMNPEIHGNFSEKFQ